jgi:hypothetical protein
MIVRLDDVPDAKPERPFIWRRLILAALRAAETDDGRQVLANTVAIQTLLQVRIKSELIRLANRSVNQIVDEFLTCLAVHCLPPRSVLLSAQSEQTVCDRTC